MSTLKAINFQNPSNSSVTMITSANNDVSFASNLTAAGNLTAGGTVSMSSPFTMRNRIINGAFDVWQRGTTYALTNSIAYGSADRFAFIMNPTAAGIANQTAAGLAGFQYALKIGRNNAKLKSETKFICRLSSSYNCINYFMRWFTNITRNIN